MKQDIAIIVFAKAPVPGYAKTRLASAIGADAAARLAERMLKETVAQALAADIGSVELCCTPDASHPAFIKLRDHDGIVLTQQGDGDLGERMCRALDHALLNHSCALLIGTDAPQLDAARLGAAGNALQLHDAVFIPTADGGYVLVGTSRPMPEIFSGVEWGTGTVMQQTRDRLSALGASWVEMPTLNDVDEPEDLVFVPTEWLK